MNTQKKLSLTDDSVKYLEKIKKAFEENSDEKVSYAKIIEMVLYKMNEELFGRKVTSEEMDELRSEALFAIAGGHKGKPPHPKKTKNYYFLKEKVVSDKEYKDFIINWAEYTSHPCGKIIVTSNGGKDGDWGHGGRTYISFQNDSCFGIEARLTDQTGNETYVSDVDKLEILVGGQHEMQILKDMIKECTEVLDKTVKDDENE